MLKEGSALCTSCGRQPEKKEVPKTDESTPIKKTLEKKLESLSKELDAERDHDRQQSILKTINSLLETMEKIKDKQ